MWNKSPLAAFNLAFDQYPEDRGSICPKRDRRDRIPVGLS